MSREAFPQLPSGAQAHIDAFPPELHASAQEQLLTLSHTALHNQGGYSNTPIPHSELGEVHQPHIDSITLHMERASQLLSSAHNALRTIGIDEQAVSFEMLAEKASEIAIQSAKEAKHAGDEQASIKALESLLVIESLRATGSTYQNMQPTNMVRTITTEGLATELVVATHETFGLVALQEQTIVPLNALARSNPKLLRAATSLEFTDDFSTLEKAKPKTDVTNLRSADLLVLAKLADAEHPGTNASRDLVKRALACTANEDVEPDDLVKILSEARNKSLDEEMDSTLSTLRLRRMAGDSRYRTNDINTVYLDDTIAQLVRGGETEIAKGLISSSFAEPNHLATAVERMTADEAEQSQLTSTLETLCSDKQTELRHHLQNNGASDSTVDWIIQETIDPDSAATIPTTFWQKLEANPSLIALMTKGEHDLARSAETLSAIDNAGLLEYGELLIQKVLQFRNSEMATNYLSSIREAMSVFIDQQKSEHAQHIDTRKVVANLSYFEDPTAALEAAKSLYGAERYMQELHSLYGLVHPQYGGYELAAFRPEDISALRTLQDYCVAIGVDTRNINAVSASLLGDSDPISRAQRITEGLRLANITANTNPSLFFEIAKREDPLSLGRAVLVLEHQITDISDSVRQELLRATVGSQTPEKTAHLIVRSQQELLKQQLSIEVIGTRKLFEVMRMVDEAENSDALYKYCSNWKIQHECENVFKVRLQPVLERGDRQAEDSDQRPTLVNFPELDTRFERLGITPEVAEGMLDSWLTYSAINRRLYDDGQFRNTVTREDIDSAVDEQSQQLLKQIESLTKYVEQFGTEETMTLTDTFGIYNFIRYKPKQLHHQLQSWKSGEHPAKNVLVSARADWNGAVSDAGTSFERVLETEGLYCFEVNDATDLAKVAVAVGNRERAMNREPELNNFIIDGHANPEGILFGTRGQHLDVTDYLKEPLNGARANTYRRHLGNTFRVILKACSTAREVAYGKNIAEAISDHHAVRVEGSKVATRGGIIIEPDGTVRFNGGDVLSTVYS